ncbi:hypothetical protein AGMMS49990_09910 [Endomicrobiia bacterium]|nr:hypothetical protein AGMMS49990_09910 [Endomicrobiia bacterium]
MYKDKPLHDKYSHGADALRYVSDAYNDKYVNVPVKCKERTRKKQLDI